MVTSCSSCLIRLKEAGGAKMGVFPYVTTMLKVVNVILKIESDFDSLYCDYRKSKYLWWR